jgi:DHA1 family bicyclomycin/chloramphenicol resistance-like MFS transporter
MAMFAALQALTMVCMSLATPNFGSIAMQPMGAIAGIAASLQGVITVVGGALLGSAIGQQFNGSAVFLPTGAVCCGMVALGLVLVAEKGRLFRVTQ